MVNHRSAARGFIIAECACYELSDGNATQEQAYQEIRAEAKAVCARERVYVRARVCVTCPGSDR